MGEQLTKYYLFVAMLISLISYQYEEKGIEIKLSISYFISSFILYIAESNFIVEDAQPIYGLSVIILLCMFLIKSHKYLSLFLVIAGFALITGGALTDRVHENESIKVMFPDLFIHFLFSVGEERFDVSGVGCFCLSSIITFRIPLSKLFNQIKEVILILLASALITIGNSFIHFQYNPSNELYLRALLLTVVGYLALIFINNKSSILSLIRKGNFNIFIFIFFVFLPSIYGQERISVSLFLWIPIIIFMGLYLWRYHPINNVAQESVLSQH